MKHIIKSLLFLALAIAASSLKAQTFKEWFQQKKTQKKYLVQQIAALNVYISYAKKGYTIAQTGLTAIEDFNNGGFNLHTDYFNSLNVVNPNIKTDVKIAGTIAYQLKIAQIYKQTYRRIQESKAFSSSEISYIYRVYGRLLADCSNTLDELIALITNNTLEMKDDGRIKRIDALYNDMQEKFSFTQSFSNEAIMLANSRIKDSNDIQTSRAVNGIKKPIR